MTHAVSLEMPRVDVFMSLIETFIAQRVPIRIDDLHSATDRDALGMRIQIFNLTLESEGQGHIIGVHDRDETAA